MRDSLDFFVFFSSPITGTRLWLLVFGSLAIILLLAVLVYLLVINILRITRFKNSFGRKIYQVAMDNDYYLINLFSFPTDDNHQICIDHILFGERYIFCISDYNYCGVLEGHQQDQLWYFYPRGIRGKKQTIKNPLVDNRKKVEKLSLLTGAEKSFFISIVLLNNDCYIDDIKCSARDEYIRNIKEFARLVTAIESRPIDTMEPKALERAVQDIAKLKEKFQNRDK